VGAHTCPTLPADVSDDDASMSDAADGEKAMGDENSNRLGFRSRKKNAGENDLAGYAPAVQVYVKN
jgi:hypothetical protein